MWRRSFSISSIWLYLSVYHTTHLITNICYDVDLAPHYVVPVIFWLAFCLMRSNDNRKYAVIDLNNKLVPKGLKDYAKWEEGAFVIETYFSRWEGFLLNTIMCRASGIDLRAEHLSYWVLRDPFRIIEYLISVITFTVWTFRLSRIPLTGLIGERKTW